MKLPLAGVVVIGAMSLGEWVECLTTGKKAAVSAIALISMGAVFGMGLSGWLGLPTELSALADSVAENSRHRQESVALFEDIRTTVRNLTCEFNNVPLTVCGYWLDNGRPDHLRED